MPEDAVAAGQAESQAIFALFVKTIRLGPKCPYGSTSKIY